MPGGRPRKPTELKVISGTAQPCRLNPAEPVGTPGAPQPPSWLSDRATELFFETIARMERMGTLCEEWRDVIADYASCVEEVEITTGIIEDLGRTYTTATAQGHSVFRPRPEVAMRSDAMKRAQSLRAELGLGPAAKSRVSAAKRSDVNPFEKLRSSSR